MAQIQRLSFVVKMKHCYIYTLLFLSLSPIGVFASACLPIPNQSGTYIIAVAEPQFYKDVIRCCFSAGGIPVKIQSAFDNAMVFSMSSDFNGVSPYIGVERDVKNDWLYADGTLLTYQNWGQKEPDMGNRSMCAAMDLQTTKWASSECTVPRPFLCTITTANVTTLSPVTTAQTTPPPTPTPTAHHCPNGWFYNQQTDYCYYLQNFTYPDGIHWAMYNWTTAEASCQRMDGHLVSIHSKWEDDFVYDLIASNVANLHYADGSGKACSFQTPWIGYYGNGRMGNGHWSDGTTVDYIGSFSKYPQGSTYWAITNDQSCDSYKQWDDACEGDCIAARFVCKKLSSYYH